VVSVRGNDCGSKILRSGAARSYQGIPCEATWESDSTPKGSQMRNRRRTLQELAKKAFKAEIRNRFELPRRARANQRPRDHPHKA
jgi:hypothetical protein